MYFTFDGWNEGLTLSGRKADAHTFVIQVAELSTLHLKMS